MTTEQQRIITRIKKLQAHADSARKLGSLNEYFAFAERISELLTKYNLSAWDLAQSADEIDEDSLRSFGFSESVSYLGEGGSSWRRGLLNVLCRYNFCRNVGDTHQKTVRIYGRGENVETTMWLYLFLTTHFLSLARQGYRRYVPPPPGRGRGNLSRYKFLRHFLLGAVDGLREYYQQQSTNASAELMLYNDADLDRFVERSGLSIVNRKQKAVRVNTNVYDAGRKVGRAALHHERKLKNSRPSSITPQLQPWDY